MTIKTSVLIIAYGLGLALLLTLSGWQISRGLHKASVIASTDTGKNAYQLLETMPGDSAQLNYQTAILQGSWDKERIILLDNRVYQSQLGYEVIMPFRLSDDKLILVNRGWISQAQAKDPALLQLQEQLPTGTLYLPKKGFTLGQAIQTEMLESDDWPKVSLYMDLEQFSTALGQPISPLMLVLDADNANSLTRIWKAVVIQPERHYAYALQWFGLAIAFIIFGIIWFRRLKQKL